MKVRSFLKRHGKQIVIDIVIGGVVMGLILAGVIFMFVATLEIPDLSSFDERRVLQSTKIYDRTGEILLYDLHQDVRRTIIPYEDISRHIKNATVAIEDDSFFEHSGIRPLSILRAVIANFKGGDLRGQGGSTITQQVIKNSILVREKTLTRKIKEAILALKLERSLTKEEILTHYLNETPYGGTLYGVEAASQAYFGRSASDVTLAEAAYLAALPQAPTYFSPYGEHHDDLVWRKNLVLSRMKELGFITNEEYESASKEDVKFLPSATTGIKAPHFVFYIKEYLAETYGEDSLAERGFKVITTLDYELQAEAEKIAYSWALKNEKTYNAENAAIVAIDPKTGHILTMVGSRDYFDEKIDGNYNIAIADRQPGSSFKPFVYASAFERGYTPETILFDLKTQFSTACSRDNMTSEGECYSPVNYDNKFRGPISMRSALAQSLNIPAVKTLYLTGIDNAIDLARKMGISTLGTKGQYGLTLVLGGGEVKLLDMVGAYSVFAGEGKKHKTTGILRIEDARGQIIEEFSESSEQVLDRQVALQISSILSDNVARTPSFGANSPLYFGNKDVAAKTGTTNDYRDTWIVGYTPTIAVGAWAGNNDNRSMAKQVAGYIVSPLWREFMDFALTKRPEERFPEPTATPSDIKPILRGVWVSASSGDQSGASSSSLTTSIEGVHNILHYVDKRNPRGPYPTNPHSDAQYDLWEYPVMLWRNGLITAAASSSNAANEDEENSSEEDAVEEDEPRRNRRDRNN